MWFGQFDNLGWLGVAALACVPALALAVDALWGEPPAPLHPVVWMGCGLGWCGERLAPLSPRAQDFKSFWLGALMWCALAAIVLIVALGLERLALQLPAPLAALVLVLLLKPLLAWRMLKGEVLAVEVALSQSLPAGRERLARLVSRDVERLDAAQVRESAIESLAENLSDSVVAPIFWFVLLGLPGAALYRFANTADAMWGYPGMRDGRYWQWAGKWAARVDDVLSWLPARLTALLLAQVARGLPLRTLAHEARKTPSPNSGWPMAAMALALGVRLAKPNVYVLHPRGRQAGPLDTRRAASLGSQAVLLLVPVAALALAAVLSCRAVG
ncbi:adenosylcobinamide-phosphate synthase CbiB [[Acidovorax] ebreus]|uniref:Cobalamin biosynthesis protein CobD n=1 Tax=Acidovorax ebreus (strain TPSY) TaxID=535289 RepID=A0A9J9Q8C1_ACIET|nr:adenosylcobinamide-phosphate synthase CbiB [[Acidovorax] ebreus]ACM33968.1 cobalamin biosynthesis protein CobD [[Acidovorax] ebreus TPSY]